MFLKGKLKPLDYCCIFFFAACLFISFFRIFIFHSSGAGTVVVSSGEDEWVFPMDSDRTVRIPGCIGVTEISVSRGGVQVLDSPCQNKLCMSSGVIKSPGEFIACVPNRVFIRIASGAEKSPPDGGEKGVPGGGILKEEEQPDIISY